MKITCISASNVALARETSTSTRVCELIEDILTKGAAPQANVEILRLLDYDLTPCDMCGQCADLEGCASDPAFTEIYQRLVESDAVFLVCPHYAPIPSKVMMVLEKLEEMTFLRWCADPNTPFSLSHKPVGIVVHGGQKEKAIPYYQKALLEPLANAFSSVQMEVADGGNGWPKGVVFGIQSMTQPPDSIFVDFTFDWEAIRERLVPLVKNTIAKIR